MEAPINSVQADLAQQTTNSPHPKKRRRYCSIFYELFFNLPLLFTIILFSMGQSILSKAINKTPGAKNLASSGSDSSTPNYRPSFRENSTTFVDQAVFFGKDSNYTINIENISENIAMNITANEYLTFYGNITAPVRGRYIKFQKLVYKFTIEEFAFVIVTNETLAVYMNSEPYVVFDKEVVNMAFAITDLVQSTTDTFDGYTVTNLTQAEVIQCSNVNSDRDNWGYNFMTISLWESSDPTRAAAKTYLTRFQIKIKSRQNISVGLMSSFAVKRLSWVSSSTKNQTLSYIGKEVDELTGDFCEET